MSSAPPAPAEELGGLVGWFHFSRVYWGSGFHTNDFVMFFFGGVFREEGLGQLDVW